MHPVMQCMYSHMCRTHNSLTIKGKEQNLSFTKNPIRSPYISLCNVPSDHKYSPINKL